jgi:hypothetical protein
LAWIRENGIGEWVRGMDKRNGLRRMESALWILQGRPERGGQLAAAFRR